MQANRLDDPIYLANNLDHIIIYRECMHLYARSLLIWMLFDPMNELRELAAAGNQAQDLWLELPEF